ncbi:MAG: hypothetical protein ACT4PZ_08145 [Panacagrimonas sp.]
MAIQQLNAVEVEAVSGGILGLSTILAAAVSQVETSLGATGLTFGVNFTLVGLLTVINSLPGVGPPLANLIIELLA